jgi:phosphoribosylformylglycinamidine (FGAM) synthase-like amidotransferase family enzyme
LSYCNKFQVLREQQLLACLMKREKKEKETHKVFISQINRTQIEQMCEIYMQHMEMHWREDIVSYVNLISGLQS